MQTKAKETSRGGRGRREDELLFHSIGGCIWEETEASAEAEPRGMNDSYLSGIVEEDRWEGE